MNRTIFASFYRRAFKTAVIFCLLFTVACQTEAERDAKLLAEDPAAVAQLRQINAAINTTRYVSPDQFEALKNLRDKYPHSADVRQTYKNALVIREDFAVLEKFLSELPAAELTRDDKITLAKVYVKRAKYQQVIDLLKPVAEEYPNSIEVRSLLGLANFNLGQMDEAAVQYDSVWDSIIRERKAEEIAQRGMIYFQQNNLSKAVETLEKALEINPEHIPSNNTLSKVYARQGDAEKAEFYRRKTVNAHDTGTANQLQASRTVQKIYMLEEAWKEKRYEEVINLSREMLPKSEGGQKMVLYQYLFESYKALGRQTEAENALAEIRKLK